MTLSDLGFEVWGGGGVRPVFPKRLRHVRQVKLLLQHIVVYELLSLLIDIILMHALSALTSVKVKVKLPLCLTKHYSTKKYGRVTV
jgi:hypothetical protein